MGDDENKVDVIRLPWRPPYSPEARSAFQYALFDRGDDYDPKYVRSEHWYISFAEIGTAVKPYLDKLLEDNDLMDGYDTSSFDKNDIDTWYILDSFGFCRVLTDAGPVELTASLDDKLAIFFPYELLEENGLLLHTRDELSPAYIEHAHSVPDEGHDDVIEVVPGAPPEISGP